MAPALLAKPRNDGTTPASIAASEGRDGCLEVIAESAPESVAAPNNKGVTPAFVAAQEGFKKCLEIIARAAPGSLSIKVYGETPAYVAIRQGNTECLRIIARHNLSAVEEKCGLRGVPPILELASSLNRSDCLRLLGELQVGRRFRKLCERLRRRIERGGKS
jgi:ankyrin repeat protein